MGHISTEEGTLAEARIIEAKVRLEMTQGKARFGQALYNHLHTAGQAGLPSSWSELFYARDEGKARSIFFDRFEMIDGYYVPRGDR